MRGEAAAIRDGVRRQREALAANDLAALEASTRDVAEALARLKAAGGPIASGEERLLRAVRIDLAANRDLLGRLGALNSRALAILVDAPATYGPAGAVPCPEVSRTRGAA